MFRFLLLFLLLGLPVNASKLLVGSRDFPESVLLAEILSSAIEANSDITVERKFHLGGVKVCISAMENELLDIYPDYSGSLMHNLLGENDLEEYYRDYLRSALEQNYNFIITESLGFDNNFVLVTTKALAETYKLKTLSDLEALLIKEPALSHKLRVGFKHSFIARPDAYKQLQKIYNFNF